ncbi:RICIN domain-containing protein [Streptomyces coeruleorubidus]
MYGERPAKVLGSFIAAAALLAIPMASAQAYNPTGGIMYRLGDEPCLKGRGNCAVYPKSAQLPGGRLVASFEKATVVPRSGSADGEYQTTSRAGYSRDLQYVAGTGRIVILNNQDTSVIAHAEVDLGHSDGTYHRLVNRRTGQVIGTGGRTNDANIGNGDVPDVRLEDAGSATDKDTQYWHVMTRPQGGTTLLNKSGGRAAAIWTGTASAGQRIGQWVDGNAAGTWNVVRTGDGYYRFQAAKNPDLYLTGASRGAPLTLQNEAADGSQKWRLVRQAGPRAD